MYWHRNKKTDSDDDVAAPPLRERSEIMQWTNLFQRDYLCWVFAILRGWPYFAILPLSIALALFVFRAATTQKIYQSSCGMIRQEPADIRNSGLPIGYTNIQRNVLLNMMRSRSVLEQTILRLRLPFSYRQLYSMTAVDLPEKNSNYFIVSAFSPDAELSAKIANTISEIFIEDLKRLIRNNLENIYENRVRSQTTLTSEIAEIQRQLKEYYSEHEMNTIDQEEANNNQRILLLEDRLGTARTRVAALRERLLELEARRELVPEDTIVYKETSVASDQALDQAVQHLYELRERYTSENPVLQKQEQLVARLEAEHKAKQQQQEGNESLAKVVTGKNLEYTNLQTEIIKTKGEVAALDSEVKAHTEDLVKFRSRREVLSRMSPQLRGLEERLTQKKDQVLKEEAVIKELQLFLERSYSDVSIQEPAQPSVAPLPRKLPTFFALGFILGLLLASGIVLVKELLNLSTRSQVDLDKALDLPALAVIPELDQHHRADFYAALQLAVSQADEILKRENAQRPIIVAVAPFSHHDLNGELLNDICEILTVRKDLSYTIIKTVGDNDQQQKSTPYLINDYLYQLADECPVPGRDRTLYFKLDDLSFISPPSEASLGRMRNALTDSDVVIWELFDFEMHRQLFIEIAKSAELTVIPMRFGKTSKLNIFRMLRQLHAMKVENLTGLLYGISAKAYRRSL